MSKIESFEISHLIWMGVIFTTNDYQPLEFNVSSERDIYEKFFISITFHTLCFVQSPLPGFEDKAARIFHLITRKFQGSTACYVDRFIEAGKARHVDPLEERISNPRLLSLKSRLQGQCEEQVQTFQSPGHAHSRHHRMSVGEAYSPPWPTNPSLSRSEVPKHSTHTNAWSLIIIRSITNRGAKHSHKKWVSHQNARKSDGVSLGFTRGQKSPESS